MAGSAGVGSSGAVSPLSTPSVEEMDTTAGDIL